MILLLLATNTLHDSINLCRWLTEATEESQGYHVKDIPEQKKIKNTDVLLFSNKC